MSIERRVTFIIGNEGFATWKLNRLKILASYFRSAIILQNITTEKTANTEHTLQVMSLGCKENDLCQLWIEGSDAELSCMVLTDFITEQFEIVNTFYRRKAHQNKSIIESHATFYLPFLINYYFDTVQIHNGIEKYVLISKISRALNKKMAQAIFKALLKREEVSSTGIGNSIAIPHAMIEGITEPAMVVLRLDKSINWSSNLGKINLIIAMLIPASATFDVVKSFTKITRALLKPINCNLLTSTIEPEAIKAILFHIMARDNNKHIKY